MHISGKRPEQLEKIRETGTPQAAVKPTTFTNRTTMNVNMQLKGKFHY